MLQLLLNSNVTDIVLVTLLRTAVETAITWYTIVAMQWRGDTALINTSIVLAAVHGLLGLPGRCARSSLHSFSPFPPVPVPNQPPRFCGRKTKCLLTSGCTFRRQHPFWVCLRPATRSLGLSRKHPLSVNFKLATPPPPGCI